MYAKVFASLWDGTMYGQPDVQLVFIFLLARCDSDGNADVTPEAIAGPTGLQVERVKEALARLESPDNGSRTPESEGARIERIDEHRDWGWHVVNYKKYRDLRDKATVREQVNERVRKHRAKKRETPCNADVTLGNAPKPHGEGEGYEEGESKTLPPSGDIQPPARKGVRGKPEPIGFAGFWTAYPRKVARLAAQRAFAKAIASDSLDAILAGLRWYTAHEWQNRDPDKIPHASTWLNQARWKDRAEQHPTRGAGPSQVNGRIGKDHSGNTIVWWNGDWRSEEAAEFLGWKRTAGDSEP